MKKVYMSIIAVLVLIIGICIYLIVDLSLKVEKEKENTPSLTEPLPVDKDETKIDKTDDKNQTEEKDNTVDAILPEIDEDMNKLLSTIALYGSIYDELNDDAIFYGLMYHLEEYYSREVDGEGYQAVIPVDRMNQYLKAFSREKNMDQLIEKYKKNYNNYDIKKVNNNYILSYGGHGRASAKVSFVNKKVENNQVILTYEATCADGETLNPISMGKVILTVKYDSSFYVDSFTFEKNPNGYSCYWS